MNVLRTYIYCVRVYLNRQMFCIKTVKTASAKVTSWRETDNANKITLVSICHKVLI